ncbi:septation protein SepH [Lysinibacter sp. HNR]|uniref:septation protein SepH n=1 Tax=Lysinibacter sp. HNR TaxID=3031408 RepID=UPI002434A132|nr:septation protein SepH [Lysinibacter sp. HNR]WGD36338.1 septation protein SepH [Lysinibacter sp. HNR]
MNATYIPEAEIMQELKVVGNENGALVVSNDTGESFRVMADDALFAEVRRLSKREAEPSKVSPRIIQAHVRAGRTHQEISDLTGASVADIERYEGPVLAERRYVLDSALQVSVVLNTAEAELQPHTFGNAINIRLDSLSASEREWSSWRDDEEGWLVRLTFVANEITHNATWQFDHKQLTLTPISSEAIILSKQEDVGDRLIPKLHAVDSPRSKRSSERFDSGAFDSHTLEEIDPTAAQSLDASEQEAARQESVPLNSHWTQEVEELAVAKADDPADFGQTSDLLEALRRRRGERESTVPTSDETDPNTTPLFDVLASTEAYDFSSDAPAEGVPVSGIRGSLSPLTSGLADGSALPDQTPQKEETSLDATEAFQKADVQNNVSPHPANDSGAQPASTRGRKKRAEMPSWDDILFGSSRSEDPV